MSLRPPRRTVRARFTLLYGGLFLLSGAALVAVTYVLFEQATAYTKPQLPQIPHAPAIHQVQVLPQLAYVQHQLAREQSLLFGSGPVAGSAGAPVPPLARQQHQLAQDQHRLARAVGQLAAAVHQVSRAGAAQAAQRTADSHQLLIDSGIALGIVVLLAVLAGWLLAGRMLRPIRTITRTAQRISSASLHERLALDGPPDELKELGDTLDDLFGRLDSAFEAQRQFVANASHELRTPLTRQRALIQVALADPQASSASLRAAHERVLASEQNLEQIIDGLLTLTRGQAGVERREPVDLAALADQVMLGREAPLATLEVHAALATAPATGDPRLLERLIANLIDNAIRHNVPGGRVEVATGARDSQAFLSVANTGAVVPEAEIERLFRPFQRLNGARTGQGAGLGLGLSIVQAIASAHHAELSARPRPEGGLAIEVTFPVALALPACS